MFGSDEASEEGKRGPRRNPERVVAVSFEVRVGHPEVLDSRVEVTSAC